MKKNKVLSAILTLIFILSSLNISVIAAASSEGDGVNILPELIVNGSVNSKYTTEDAVATYNATEDCVQLDMIAGNSRGRSIRHIYTSVDPYLIYLISAQVKIPEGEKTAKVSLNADVGSPDYSWLTVDGYKSHSYGSANALTIEAGGDWQTIYTYVSFGKEDTGTKNYGAHINLYCKNSEGTGYEGTVYLRDMQLVDVTGENILDPIDPSFDGGSATVSLYDMSYGSGVATPTISTSSDGYGNSAVVSKSDSGFLASASIAAGTVFYIQNVPLLANRTYIISADVKSSQATSAYIQSSSDAVALTANTWTHITYPLETTSTSATKINIGITKAISSSSLRGDVEVKFYVDNLSIIPLDQSNIASKFDSGFEWSSTINSAFTDHSGGTLSRVSNEASEGSYSVKAVRSGRGIEGGLCFAATMSEGIYEVSFDVKAVSGSSVTAAIGYDFTDASETETVAGQSKMGTYTPISANEWTRIKRVYINDGTNTGTVKFGVATNSLVDLYYDNVEIREVKTADTTVPDLSGASVEYVVKRYENTLTVYAEDIVDDETAEAASTQSTKESEKDLLSMYAAVYEVSGRLDYVRVVHQSDESGKAMTVTMENASDAKIASIYVWKQSEDGLPAIKYVDMKEESGYINVEVAAARGTNQDRVSVYGNGAYSPGDILISAGTKLGSGLILDSWTDRYGNKVSPQSQYLMRDLQADVSNTATFGEYEYSTEALSVTSGDSLKVTVESPVVTATTAVADANIVVPANYSLIDCGVIFYPGIWTENFNLFSDGIKDIGAESTIATDGSYSATATMETKYGVLARAYAILLDDHNEVIVQYSNSEYTEAPNALPVREYDQIINYELMACVTGSNVAEVFHDFSKASIINGVEYSAEEKHQIVKDYNQSYIDMHALSGADVITITPQIYKTNLWNSDNGYNDYRTDLENIDQTQDRWRKKIKYYIESGGDYLADVAEAIENTTTPDGKKMEMFINYRMNEHHRNADLTYVTHNEFWLTHSEWWRYPEGESATDRVFNYMYPGVRERYYDMFNELLTKYDPDGLELDFDRYPVYFRDDEISLGTEVLTEFVGSIREMANKLSVDRGKKIMLSVRVPCTQQRCITQGIDPITWDEKGYVDIINLSNHYINTLNVEIENFQEKTSHAQIFGEMHYVTFQAVDEVRRYVTPEVMYATAANFMRRGADGVSSFNMVYLPRKAMADEEGYYPHESGQSARDIVISSLNNLDDADFMKSAEKNYILDRSNSGFDTSAVSPSFDIVIADDTDNFDTAVVRIEFKDDCTDINTDGTENFRVYFNGHALDEEDTVREHTEFFGRMDTDISYPETSQYYGISAYPDINNVKFYNLPLEYINSNALNTLSISNPNKRRLYSADIALLN